MDNNEPELPPQIIENPNSISTYSGLGSIAPPVEVDKENKVNENPTEADFKQMASYLAFLTSQ